MLIAQLHTMDIQFIVDKCCSLMASDIHNIKLFTNNFIKKLFNCSDLKNYLLPFITWLDSSILREFLSIYEESNTLELVYNFNCLIDNNQPITSYPIPSFSQLIIPLDNSEYTIVATKTVQNCNELVLKEVRDIKEFLQSLWELTAHAIQLAAIDYIYNCIYWIIPKQVKSLIENKLNHTQHELWDRGIFQAVLLQNDFYSPDNDFEQVVITNPFNLLLTNLTKVCA